MQIKHHNHFLQCWELPVKMQILLFICDFIYRYFNISISIFIYISASEDVMVQTPIFQLKIIVKTVLYLKQFVKLESFQVIWNIFNVSYRYFNNTISLYGMSNVSGLVIVMMICNIFYHLTFLRCFEGTDHRMLPRDCLRKEK